MTCGLVRTSYSLPKWQAVKLTLFAPWHQPRSQGSLLPGPMERERERPWKTLVTWLQNKIISEGGVLGRRYIVTTFPL